jgi:hypothetical protein
MARPKKVKEEVKEIVVSEEIQTEDSELLGSDEIKEEKPKGRLVGYHVTSGEPVYI